MLGGSEGSAFSQEKMLHWWLQGHRQTLVPCGCTCLPTCTPTPSLPVPGAHTSLSSCSQCCQDCRGGNATTQRSSASARDDCLLRAGESGVFCPWPVVRGAIHQREPKPGFISAQMHTVKGDQLFGPCAVMLAGQDENSGSCISRLSADLQVPTSRRNGITQVPLWELQRGSPLLAEPLTAGEGDAACCSNNSWPLRGILLPATPSKHVGQVRGLMGRRAFLPPLWISLQGARSHWLWGFGGCHAQEGAQRSSSAISRWWLWTGCLWWRSRVMALQLSGNVLLSRGTQGHKETSEGNSISEGWRGGSASARHSPWQLPPPS